MQVDLAPILARTEWFRRDRFGLFIHWGPYSVLGKGEWVRSTQRLSIEEYEPCVEAFQPDLFDAKAWARLAKAAGMRYMVLTAKHHDGFCLFDSKFTSYKSTATCGRDFVREFVEAARAEGLRVGLYYSLIDWHHPDYPKYRDLIHPMRGNELYRDESIHFERYIRYLHSQVEELVTSYGRLDLLWFDYSYGEMTGETWQATKLIEMVRRHQAEVIIDNRLEASGASFGSLVEGELTPYSGDFVSPEQCLPPEGIRNVYGQAVPWELCLSMNNHWAYNPTDMNYKSPKQLIRKLVECVSKNGNMILNVGPTARGEFNAESLAILNGFGKWMKHNHESVYGCGASFLPKPEWGYYTQRDQYLYAHLFDAPIGPIPLIGLKASQIKRLTFLHDGSELSLAKSWTTEAYGDLCFAHYGEVAHFTYPLPCEVDTVIRIELQEGLTK